MTIRHEIRVNGKGKTSVVELDRKRAIIQHCKECMGFNANEVRRCTDHLCPLYPFRTHDAPKERAEIAACGNLRNENQRKGNGASHGTSD